MSDKSIMNLTDDEIDAILNQLPSSIHQSVTNETLRLTLADVDKKIRKLNDSLDYYQSVSVQIQDEPDRRALDAYWAAHPDLIRLEVGDKLVITEALKDLIENWNGYKVGNIGTITSINPEIKTVYVTWNDCQMSGLYIGKAQQFRRAYLEQESRNATNPT